jgi:transposase InsO family protein
MEGTNEEAACGTERSGVPHAAGPQPAAGQSTNAGCQPEPVAVRPDEAVAEPDNQSSIVEDGTPLEPEDDLQELLDEALTPGPDREEDIPQRSRLLCGRRKGSPRTLTKKADIVRPAITPEQRLLLLDTWQRSGLPARDFGDLVGVTRQSLFAWKKAFDAEGPAGLMDGPRGGPRGMKLPELTKRTILMLKETNPAWGCQRISDMLLRGPALPASPTAVAKVLHEAGYELHEEPTHPHPDKVRSFERARPNQLWQTDLFTFILKRQNRRVYLVAFMDDHRRFIVSYGLHASQSSALVLEVLRAGITSYNTPQEILTDNGSQYITWRGKSAFTRELEKRGIQQVVAAPRRPQTLGKVERFWGTLWRECLEGAVFLDLGDAQRRIGLFIDYYNFQRPHQSLNALAPADRFFGAAPEVLRTLKERVAANALELARQGIPKKPFYLTGQVGGKAFSVHAEGERVILTREQGVREEIELTGPEAPIPAPEPQAQAEELPLPICPVGVINSALADAQNEPEPEPGCSPLDKDLSIAAAARPQEGGGQ